MEYVSLSTLSRDWKLELARLLEATKTGVLVSSPYISQPGVRFLIKHLPIRAQPKIQLTVLTDLSPMNVIQNSTDPAALETLGEALPKVRFHHLPRLHAKVYVSDESQAIVTSGNLTSGGLNLNYEYGIFVQDSNTVKSIRRELVEYALLGVEVNLEQLEQYRQIVQEVKVSYAAQQRSVSLTTRQAFEAVFAEASDGLIRLRLAESSLHGVFAKTVLYLLRRYGPLSTKEPHPMVEAIHPDLCDNTVDRVINGVRFGKKWKHGVRTAQQYLKRQGLIRLDGSRWSVTS